MKFPFILSLAFILTSFNSTLAQEQKKSVLDISLTGTVQTGNSERLLLINSVKFVWYNEKESLQFQTLNRYVYGTVGSFNKENDFRSANYLFLYVNKNWNPVLGLFFEKIKIKGIDAIIKPMAGIQYNLFDNKKLKIKPQILIGYAWQQYIGNSFSNFDNMGSNSINGSNFNAAINVSLKAFENNVTFTLFSIYQVDLEVSRNKRFWFDFNIQIPIWKHVYGRFSFNNYYENIVLEKIKKNDSNISYGLGLKL